MVADDFGALFDAHHTAVYRLALLLSGDPVVAEDAVAEAFARTWPRWQRGEIRDPGPYLRRAVVNQVRGRFRRRVLERREDVRRRGDERGPRAHDDRTVDRDEMVRALLRLPVRQRTAIVLRYYDDLSEAETAAVMGTSVGTVKAQVSRGLERLRTLLPEESRL